MQIHPIANKKLLLSIIKLFSIFIFLTVLIELTNTDRNLADWIYKWQGNNWQFKDAWITATFIHKGGKYFSISMLLILLLLFFLSYFSPKLITWKYRLGYLLAATLTGVLFVSIGKWITYISCPWDFSRYGGTLEYLPLIKQLWIRNGNQCFPAGHASAGFAWVALYFVGLHTKSLWRWTALLFALLMGIIFGISQQLRGAHFLSHDLWSFGICWMVSFIFYEVMLKPYEPAK